MVKDRLSGSEKEVAFVQLVPQNPREVAHQCHYGEEESMGCMGSVQNHQGLFSGCLLRPNSFQLIFTITSFREGLLFRSFPIHPVITQTFFVNLNSHPSSSMASHSTADLAVRRTASKCTS